MLHVVPNDRVDSDINVPRHCAAESNLTVFGNPMELKSLINLAANVLARRFGTGIANANFEALQIAISRYRFFSWSTGHSSPQTSIGPYYCLQTLR
jgi:hypothetical protein